MLLVAAVAVVAAAVVAAAVVAAAVTAAAVVAAAVVAAAVATAAVVAAAMMAAAAAPVTAGCDALFQLRDGELHDTNPPRGETGCPGKVSGSSQGGLPRRAESRSQNRHCQI